MRPGFLAQNDYAVRQQNGLFDVVCDHENRAGRHLLAQPQFEQFTAQVFSGEDVKRGKGFVHEQDFRFDDQRAGETHTLFHAAGELLGIRGFESVESDGIEHLQGALPALNRAHTARLERGLDIFEDVQPRK